MIAGEEGIDYGDQAREVVGPIHPPAHAFLAYRTVEAFNRGLFVFLVWPGHVMTVTIGMRPLGTCPFELWAPIGLQHLAPSCNTPGHGGMQQSGAVITGERRPKHDIRLFGVHIDPGEGEEVA